MSIEAFKINISEEILIDLKNRILGTRWPKEDLNMNWEDGPNINYLKDLAQYWAKSYNWREIEIIVNSLPNYQTIIDGYNIHFIHLKGKGKDSIPLIMTHGWPSSFLEFIKIIPLLVDNQEFTFDLVIPSLIGYGFSQNPNKLECTPQKIANLWFKLMKKLGYDKFGAHGGDFGADVSIALGLYYPKSIIGLHLTGADYYIPFIPFGSVLSQKELSFNEYLFSWSEKEGAYSHLHKTKPLTLSYSLNDSPVGLCAWIIEKFYSWSDCKGNLESVFSKDELLSNVTLYWVTETIYSSIQLYRDFMNSPLQFSKDDYINCPVAFAHFPLEDLLPPREMIERGFNVKQWTEMLIGGHFASIEQPYLLSKDIIDFFKSIRFF